MFHVIIAGTRSFDNYNLLRNVMDVLLSDVVAAGEGIRVISGDAPGADRLGAEYASERGYEVVHCPADWDTHGKAAGYIRNTEMAHHGNALVAFWDGESRGTRHMIKTAESLGLEVRVFEYRSEPPWTLKKF